MFINNEQQLAAYHTGFMYNLNQPKTEVNKTNFLTIYDINKFFESIKKLKRILFSISDPKLILKVHFCNLL